MSRRIAIIGAGASGICVAKHMLGAEGDVELIPVLFDQNSDIGGLWIYEEVDDNEGANVHSSLYNKIMAVLPKQVMHFPDFRFPEETKTYMSRHIILKYLQSYAEHFNVKKHVRFNTKVVNVEPILDGEQDSSWIGTRWVVTYQDLITNETNKDEFDGVIICNGHLTKPFIPALKGVENYKKVQQHCHTYRGPESFAGKRALVWGFGPSGRDISLELSTKCSTVYVSHKDSGNQDKFPENMVEKTELSHVNKDGLFVFEDGSEVDVDVLIYCTGYSPDLSFVSDKFKINMTEDGRAIHDIYKQMFFIENPSMCTVGLPWAMNSFPLMHQQSAYVTAIFSGKINLPSKAEMQEEFQKEFEESLQMKKSSRYFHMFFFKQFDYNDTLATLSGCPKNPRVIRNLFWHCMSVMQQKPLLRFKETEFKIIDDENFEILK